MWYASEHAAAAECFDEVKMCDSPLVRTVMLCLSMMTFVDFTGLLGAALLLWAFVQSSRGKWHGHMMIYQVVNIAAGVVLVYYTFSKAAYFATFINVVWACVALVGAVRLLRDPATRRMHKQKPLPTAKRPATKPR